MLYNTCAIRSAMEEDPIGGSIQAMKGFPHMRKAHCMFGWDWGPRLPDAGIYRGTNPEERSQIPPPIIIAIMR